MPNNVRHLFIRHGLKLAVSVMIVQLAVVSSDHGAQASTCWPIIAPTHDMQIADENSVVNMCDTAAIKCMEDQPFLNNGGDPDASPENCSLWAKEINECVSFSPDVSAWNSNLCSVWILND